MPLASRIPAAADGFSADVARRIQERVPHEQADVGGIAGTLAANVLSLAVMRATLTEVLTDSAFERMIYVGERFESRHSGEPVMARAQYWRWRMDERDTNPGARCC
jgi:glutamate-1-semialdehyde 2,1-aminomutase